MTSEAYERLILMLLASDDIQTDATPDEDEIEETVAEAASLLADLRTTTADLAGAAVWQQVADHATDDTTNAGHHPELLPEPWSSACAELKIRQERPTN